MHPTETPRHTLPNPETPLRRVSTSPFCLRGDRGLESLRSPVGRAGLASCPCLHAARWLRGHLQGERTRGPARRSPRALSPQSRRPPRRPPQGPSQSPPAAHTRPASWRVMAASQRGPHSGREPSRRAVPRAGWCFPRWKRVPGAPMLAPWPWPSGDLASKDGFAEVAPSGARRASVPEPVLPRRAFGRRHREGPRVRGPRAGAWSPPFAPSRPQPQEGPACDTLDFWLPDCKASPTWPLPWRPPQTEAAAHTETVRRAGHRHTDLSPDAYGTARPSRDAERG